MDLMSMQQLYSCITGQLSLEGVRIITPVVSYELMSFGVVFVERIIPQFLKLLEGNMATLSYWRSKFVNLESDEQLTGFVNEFINALVDASKKK